MPEENVHIINDESGYTDVPSAKVKVDDALRLVASASFCIGFGKNDDPEAPYLAVTMSCAADGGVLCDIVFQEEPPLEAFADAAIGLGALVAGMAGEAEGALDLISAAANRALTPKAEVVIQKHDHWIDIWLAIGDWEGHHKVRFSEIRKLFAH
jgi:hypothetical protein